MILLAAGWVLPIGGPPIRDGRVAVENGRIAWVGSPSSPGLPKAPLHDLGNGVLMPGLVNAHCHLELSYLRGRIEAQGYVPWIEAVVAARGTASEAEMAAAAAAAIQEMKAGGTVALADVSNSLMPLPALRASGLRGVVLHELLAWDPAAAERVFAGGKARVAEAEHEFPVRLAAHAPHSVSRALLALMVAEGGPAGIHLAESADETSFLGGGDGAWAAFLERRGLGHVRAAPAREGPVAYLDRLGALHGRLIAAHCVQVDAGDARTLARRGVHVALCPRSNDRLGVGRPPLPLLLAAGANVCVGTDSLASAPSLNVLDDVAVLHRMFPEVAAATLLEMATVNGATALGIEDLGTLGPGMSARMAYAPSRVRAADPEAFLVSGEARLRPVAA